MYIIFEAGSLSHQKPASTLTIFKALQVLAEEHIHTLKFEFSQFVKTYFVMKILNGATDCIIITIEIIIACQRG